MKQFRVIKAFNPRSRPDLTINEGVYPISDWRIGGFTFDTTAGKVSISSEEVAPVGKVMTKIGASKNG